MQQLSTRYDWVGKGIHCARNLNSALRTNGKCSTKHLMNETQTPMGFWHTNGSPNLGQTTRPYDNKKRTCKIVDFAVPADHKIKLSTSTLLGNWKNVEHKSDNYTNCNWCSWYNHRRIIKWTGRLGNNWTIGDHPNYYIIEIGQNTENSLGDLRRFAVTQTPAKDHQLTLMWKTLKE